MPLNGSVGFSENTQLKQQHFDTLMRVLCPALQSIIRRYDWVYPRAVYIDMNAGPGYYPEADLLGSPLLTWEAARRAQLPLEAYCFEENTETWAQLVIQLRARMGLEPAKEAPHVLHLREPDANRWACCINQPYQRNLPWLVAGLAATMRQRKQSALGVIYSDENGTMPPLLYLALAAARLRCDVVLHVSASNVKRVRYSQHTDWDYSLADCMTVIGRDHWFIREPYGRHQWTFLVGSQWDHFPVLTGQGFHALESPTGQAWFALLNERRQEAS